MQHLELARVWQKIVMPVRALPRRSMETDAPPRCAGRRPLCVRTGASAMRPHPCRAASPRRTRLGNRLRRTGKFLEGPCSKKLEDLSTFQLPFLKFPMPQSGLPNLPGDGHGPCDKGRRHIGLPPMWRRTWRGMRTRIPGSFLKSGAVAPLAECLRRRVECGPMVKQRRDEKR